MKLSKTTLGLIAGGGAAALGALLIHRAAEVEKKQSQPDGSTKLQEVGGIALLVSGVSLALSSGVAGINKVAAR